MYAFVASILFTVSATMRGLGSHNILVAKGALGVAYIASAVVYFALKKLKQRMQYNAYEVSEPIFPWYEKV